MVLIDFGFGGIRIAANAAGPPGVPARVLAVAARMQLDAGDIRVAPQRRKCPAGHTLDVLSYMCE